MKTLFCRILWKRLQFKIFLYLITLGIVYHIYSDRIFNVQHLNPLSSRHVELRKFTDYESANTVTFHMVCLTNKVTKVKILNRKCLHQHWYTNTSHHTMGCRRCHHPQKFITVYLDTKSDVNISNHRDMFSLIGFDIKFKTKSELPSNFTIIQNQTAYFLGWSKYPYEPENFFHFTKQIYFPLYWLIHSTNQLHKDSENVVFYSRPYGTCRNKMTYFDAEKYQYFRDILYVKNRLELSAFTDQQKPHEVCYKNAVFSNEFFLDKAPHAISHFKHKLKVNDESCGPKVLTVINRLSYRRILNTDEMVQVGNELGYDTKVVIMESKTLREQAQLIHCTRILVGVTGAGLQWAFFMKNYSGVIEIAWPQKDWLFFFTGSGDYQSDERDVIRPLKFVQLNGTCNLNPPAVNEFASSLFHAKFNIPYQDSLEILQNPVNYDCNRSPAICVGKLCDVTVDKEAFRDAVIEAAKA